MSLHQYWSLWGLSIRMKHAAIPPILENKSKPNLLLTPLIPPVTAHFSVFLCIASFQKNCQLFLKLVLTLKLLLFVSLMISNLPNWVISSWHSSCLVSGSRHMGPPLPHSFSLLALQSMALTPHLLHLVLLLSSSASSVSPMVLPGESSEFSS